MNDYSNQFRPTLSQVALTLSAFALMLAFVTFWPLTSDNLIFKRTHATAWAMTLLATPAFYIFARTYGREPLTNWWRLSWTAGWVMSVIHAYYGLWGMHDGDVGSVFERQGWALAGTIFALTAVWGWDVFNAWARPDWEEDDILSRRPAFWIGAVAFFISTVLFNNDIQSLICGLILTAALLVGVLQRIDGLDGWDDFFASEATILILGVGAVLIAMIAPTFLSSADMTNTEIAAMQAKWTAWPVIFLGGVAAALFIAKAPENLQDWGWPNWQIAGAAAYGVHVYAGFDGGFDWSVTAMFDQQGVLVGWANIALLAMWAASAVVAWIGWRAMWLHGAATALFIVAGVVSSYFLGDSVIWLTGALVVAWVCAAAARFSD